MCAAAYLTNRSSTSSILGKSPEEAWVGKKPTISHLKVFGCTAYMHTPKEKRQKFDDKSSKCILVGYFEESKPYRVYELKTRKVQITCDVIFNEEDKETDFGSMNNRQVIEEQPECSSLRKGHELEVPVGPESVIPEMATDVVGDVKVEYERFQFEEAHEKTLPKWYTLLMKDAEGKLPAAQGKRKSKMRPEQVNFALMAEVLTEDELSTFEEARKEQKWNAIMDAKIQAVRKNKTWDLVKLPASKKAIGCRWVYKTKYRADGSIDKHKVRLIAKGYKQQEGIDYQETFALGAKMNIVQIILALVAQLNWQLYQMDVKSAFLNEDLSEEVYMEQPPVYVQKGKEDHVYHLKKALYGLKQAPRAWYEKIDRYFLNTGFVRSSADSNLYMKL
eukprot:Gb_40420 [translate_table: standard]